MNRKSSKQDKPNITKHRSPVACIIRGENISSSRLTQLARESSDDQVEILLLLKFVACDGNKRTHTTYDPSPVYVNIIPSQLRVARQGTFYIDGVISKVPQSTQQRLSRGYFRGHHDDIPTEWFREGNILTMVHHGIADGGFIISILDPANNAKLSLHA